MHQQSQLATGENAGVKMREQANVSFWLLWLALGERENPKCSSTDYRVENKNKFAYLIVRVLSRCEGDFLCPL